MIPKQIDFLDKDSGIQAQGIYQLEGGRLMLCWDREFKTRVRPKKFAAEEKTEPFLLVLVREKKN